MALAAYIGWHIERQQAILFVADQVEKEDRSPVARAGLSPATRHKGKLAGMPDMRVHSLA